ncbi:hypothetical protein NQ315_006541 [Exocentrus adspersus]|uniref:Uncharacterized protein n=1 Tax=Exocentrus adspersus TaxID=1586481 RepID=A0AAV8W0W3_9CUCU|nr:hypothetical protein NQ315_006541 [Exocentrus adspersus]
MYQQPPPYPVIPYQQYFNAYPTIHYQQPPSASNGYGWHGNGYGWQLDPKQWHTPPLYPSLQDQVVEEPVIQAEKVTKQNAWCDVYFNANANQNLAQAFMPYGEKGSGTAARTGQSQDFYSLRDECLRNGTLFEDREFPATDSSLFFSQRPDRYYEWKRPSEIVDDPQFFVEGFSRFDVQQGELGDCWLLAAAANLTLYRRLFFQIVPDDQGFDDKYAGIFHFRFWQYGRWVDVVIDDRLPTYRGELIFLHSTEENEFWSALLEKAYAKIHGSYEALKGGSTCEAMEDFTGGVTEMYELDASPPNLFQIMLKAYERSSLMGCSIEPDPNVLEAQTPEGLIKGHAYSITRVQFVDIQTPNTSGKIPLLRLRNPWGNESEWNGAWSDGAPEWRFISESEKEELGLTFDNDGEFWMSFKDFQHNFSRVEICNLNPDSLTEDELMEGHKKKWEMSVFEGEWVRGVSAESFWHNPQYRITLTEVDEDDDEGGCTMIVALMQKNRRQIRSTGADLLTVGFAIYHLPYPDRVPKPLDVNFFKYNASVARSPSFINLREVSCRFKLPPGTYCIVPSTFDPNEEGEFLLRVFTENENIMEYDGYSSDYISSHRDNEVDDDEPPSAPQPQSPHPYVPPYPTHNAPHSPDGYPYPQPSYPSGPSYPGYPPASPQGSGYPGENDEKIGYGELDAKVSKEPTPEELEDSNKVYDTFKALVGEDGEVDWRELKEILDTAMKAELQQSDRSVPVHKTTVKGVDAAPQGAPQQQTQIQSGDGGFITALLGLICGALCKDNPLMEIIPPPTQTTALNARFFELQVSQFSKDICRSMVAMLDADRSGKLNYVEFVKLWTSLRKWKNAWLLHDADRSGTFSGFELRDALNAAGYRLNNRILNILMHRYGNKQGGDLFR